MKTETGVQGAQPVALPDALTYAARMGWAVTREWVRGWDCAREALAAAPVPADQRGAEAEARAMLAIAANSASMDRQETARPTNQAVPPAQLAGWIAVKDQVPQPEVCVLCWDGKQTFVEWFGSRPDAGRGVTHWIPYPMPPGAASDMHDGRRALAPTLADSATVQVESAQVAPAADERAAFENWASDSGQWPKTIQRNGDGYLLAITQTFWSAWMARAALAAEPVKPQEPAALKQLWADAYAAFKGAFDTAAERHRRSDEYSADARRRLRDFDEAFAALAVKPQEKQGEPVRLSTVIRALEGQAANTDTDPRWKAAETLRELPTWESATLPFAATQAEPLPGMVLVPAARDVLAERRRQIDAEGWDAEHDDTHSGGGMAFAAAAYAVHAHVGPSMTTSIWRWTGWAAKWFKPRDARSDLVRAGALILAEIERLDRAAAPKAVKPSPAQGESL